jgi:hypothetical protein
MVDASRAQDKTPITTQAMWDKAYEDYTYADIMARAARNDPAADPQIVVHRERARRIRLAIANAIEFLITNERDIDTVIAARKRREGS